VQFSADLRERVADGTITVSYRLWSRPKVKVGGIYRSTDVLIEIDDIDLVRSPRSPTRILLKQESRIWRAFADGLHTRAPSTTTQSSVAWSSTS
jgi:hypothetical protein